MSNKREKIARVGIATKGVVYTIIGVLTAMTAFGQGGKKTGKSGVLDFLSNQSFGQVLLVIIGIGLLAYALFRFYQAFVNSGENDDSGFFKRAGYFISGIIYGYFAYASFTMVGGSGGNSQSRESLISRVLGWSGGEIIIAVVGLILLIKGIREIYKAYSGDYKDRLQNAGLGQKAQDLMLKAGRIGYTARGIVIGVIAYLTLKAAFTGDAGSAGGSKDAFSYVQNEFGSIVMGILALGVAAYGIFQFIKAKYAGVAYT